MTVMNATVRPAHRLPFPQNEVLLRFWQAYEPDLSRTVAREVDELIAEHKPDFLESIATEFLSLGAYPPHITEVLMFEGDFAPNEILLQLDLHMRSRSRWVLAVTVGRLLLGKKISVKVEGLKIEGKLLVKMKFTHGSPYCERLWFSFVEQPKISVAISAVNTKLNSVPGLSSVRMAHPKKARIRCCQRLTRSAAAQYLEHMINGTVADLFVYPTMFPYELSGRYGPAYISPREWDYVEARGVITAMRATVRADSRKRLLPSRLLCALHVASSARTPLDDRGFTSVMVHDYEGQTLVVDVFNRIMSGGFVRLGRTLVPLASSSDTFSKEIARSSEISAVVEGAGGERVQVDMAFRPVPGSTQTSRTETLGLRASLKVATTAAASSVVLRLSLVCLEARLGERSEWFRNARIFAEVYSGTCQVLRVELKLSNAHTCVPVTSPKGRV